MKKKEIKMNRLSSCKLILLCLVFIFSLLNCSNAHNKNSVRRENNDIKAIDLYRLEVAFKISKNWEFDRKRNSEIKSFAAIAFKIFPDGTIKQIQFAKRSGDPALDEAAFRTINKSSPTIPFPENVNEQEVKMGLRFDYNGVR